MKILTALTVGVLVLCFGSGALGQTPLTTIRVASGLTRPLYVTHAPGDYKRVFIVEQRSGTTGRIKILNLANGVVNATPFLSISPVSTLSEQGLLGLAFHPNYAANGFFYVFYTEPGPFGGTAVIARYTVSANPDIADPLSAMPVLRLFEPTGFHNGGWIAFGADGYLWVAAGDGGKNNAQTITGSLLGKILRLDVNGDDFPADPLRNYAIPPDNPFVGATGDDEIWAYGLRNPWRCSHDRLTGDLWIADVGQSDWEELNFEGAQTSPFVARNYGWMCMEGFHCTGIPVCTCNAPELTLPIHEYAHGGSPFNCSITGGYVYRGCAIPDLQGWYFFSDYCSARLWSLRYNGTVITDFVDRTAELHPGAPMDISNVSSFGEDALGELYICDLTGGEVFKIVPAVVVGPDCNNNGRRDACDIQSGLSADTNNNGIPDECEPEFCYPNCNGDGTPLGQPLLNIADFGCFQSKFAVGDPYADCNGDTLLNLADFGCFQTKFALGCR